MLSFGRSADVLVILILGGAGRLYGGIIGAIIYMVARDQFSGINPQYWYFWIGLLLVAVVMFLPNGILGGLSGLFTTKSLNKRFGSLVVAQDIDLELPRGRALRADRPERRRQDHAHQPDDRHAAPDCRAASFLGGEDITALNAGGAGERAGLARTFQINTLFPQLTALESVTLAVLRARGTRAQLVAGPAALRRAARGSLFASSNRLNLQKDSNRVTRELAYGQQRLLEIALALATRPQRAAARRARRRRAARTRAPSCSRRSRASRAS